MLFSEIAYDNIMDVRNREIAEALNIKNNISNIPNENNNDVYLLLALASLEIILKSTDIIHKNRGIRLARNLDSDGSILNGQMM